MKKEKGIYRVEFYCPECKEFKNAYQVGKYSIADATRQTQRYLSVFTNPKGAIIMHTCETCGAILGSITMEESE